MNSLEEKIILLMHDRNPRFVSLLYDNYADSLYGIVIRIIKDENLAKDVMQESFTKVWQKCHRYNNDKSRLFTWLLQIFRNTAIDFLRKNQRHQNENIQNTAESVYMISSYSTNPDTMDILDKLGDVEDKYKKVLEALYLNGMTQKEASKHLSIPLGTVKSRAKLGLNYLRKIYTQLVLVFIVLIDFL